MARGKTEKVAVAELLDATSKIACVVGTLNALMVDADEAHAGMLDGCCDYLASAKGVIDRILCGVDAEEKE